MKENYTPSRLNDAMNAEDECPFCFIERNVEQGYHGLCSRLLRFFIWKAIPGGYTTKPASCTHYKKMFDYGNTLETAGF